MKKGQKSFKSILITLSIAVFMVVVYFISGVFFEPKAYNFMTKLFSADKVGSDDVVVIIIDDKSLEKIRWPWKRTEYGKIFEYLSQSNAKVIGFDAVVANPNNDDPQSDIEFFNKIAPMKNLVVGFSPIYGAYSNLQEGLEYEQNFNEKFAMKFNDYRKEKPPSFYKSLSKFPQGYFDSVSKVGSILITPSQDGYRRMMDQIVAYNGNLYPSFGLGMYSFLNNVDHFNIYDDKITANNTKLNIPSYSRYNGVFNNIRFYKLRDNSEYSHKSYSAIDIIESLEFMKKGEAPSVSPKEFEDKIVIVGSNAKALAIALEDALPTPMHLKHPGVDVQATNLDNLLHNEFMTLCSGTFDLVTSLIILAITFLVIRYTSLFVSIGVNSLVIIVYLIFAALCYKFDYAISVITPIMLQVIMMTVAYSYRFILEGRNKEKIKKAMGKYISEDIMHDVVKNIDDIKLGGKRANVTVLFADIRGFTSMSENMSAQEVSVILNTYFSEIEPIITAHNGVINKFIGDAVLAIFGEPIQDKNHATNAVKCGYAMLKKVNELQQKWIDDGKPKIEIGIGINTGEAFVGNIGSEKRLEYTVIGDTVNLASRIESYNKIYKTNFLISNSTYTSARAIVDVIKISDVSIRGKAKKLDLYEVLRVS